MKSSNIVLRVVIIALLLAAGCEKISQGSQRKKFEFLYKMNNYATLFREYTGGINYSSDISFYDNRMHKLYDDVSLMPPVESYDVSKTLKEKFLMDINENIKSAAILKNSTTDSTESIRNLREISLMEERVDDFIKELNDEIAVVGKEQ